MATPLTKHSKEGVLYVRPPEVESNIDSALNLETAVLIQRARETDRDSLDYLNSECLVHLIRAALRSGDDSRYNALLPILLSRGEAILKSKIGQSVPNAELLREEVLSQLGVLFANESGSEPSDVLDYFECKFNRAFRTLRCWVLRREEGRTEGAEVLSDGSEGGNGSGRPANLPECRATQEDGFHLADLCSSIDMLPHQLQRVIALKAMGYVIESHDSKKVTIATLCGVSGRTVRDRLSQARRLIMQMRLEAS